MRLKHGRTMGNYFAYNPWNLNASTFEGTMYEQLRPPPDRP